LSDTEVSSFSDVVEAAIPDDNPSPGEGTDCDIDVFLDGTDVSDVSITGSVTRRLNRPAQAQITIPMDYAIGGPGSRLKIYFNGSLFFHGMVMDCETDSGEDIGYTVYNAMDPMELWSWRPARDGPDSSDPGDFSNPQMFSGIDYTPYGGDILRNMLEQSVDDSDPALGEGPLFLDFGTFESSGVEFSGAPVDWPMTIAEVTNLMISTGELDVVITPTDPGGGVMGTVDSYNGDYGTDRSGSVTLSYGMGDYSIRRVRWNQDMTNICNKLWYYAGPRIETAADPAGDQHWCFNVQGDDPCFNGGVCPSPDAAAMETAYTAVSACRGTDSETGSRGTYGVRMEVQIFDAASENCVGQGGIDPGRDLYRWLWLAESWARCNPRELIHVTPIRGYPIGNFDIGDLITVQATSAVRGGFSGAQRIYQYTVSWTEDGPCEISELQTSSDAGL